LQVIATAGLAAARAVVSTLLALVIALAAAGAGSRPAEAHAFLVRTAPAAGERLGGSPSVIQLQFSEPVASLQGWDLRSRDGARVAIERPEMARGGIVAEAYVPPLGVGVYLVSWQVVAAVGHLSVGEFAFAVGAAGGLVPSPTASAGQLPPWPATLAHLLFIGGLLLALGGLAAELVVLTAEARGRLGRLPLSLPLSASAAGGVGQLVWLLASSRSLSNLVTERPGLVALVELGAVTYALWLLPVRRLRPLIAVPLLVALVAAAVAGHPGGFDPLWAPFANLVHLAAVSLWLGGLAALVVLALRVPDSRLLVAAVGRYARFAPPAAAVAVAGGAVVALAELTSPADLVATAYGQVLALKALTVGGALALALAGRRLLRRIAPAAGALALSRLVRVEAGALVVVVGLAALLANLPTPRAAAGGPDLLGEPLPQDAAYAATLAGNLAVYLVATSDQLQVRVVEPTGPSASGPGLALSGRLPGGGQVTFFPRQCGGGCLATSFRWPAGTTAISVTAEPARPWHGGTAQVQVPWPPAPEDPALADAVARAMRALPTVAFSEHVTSGPGTGATDQASMTGEQFLAQELYVGGGSSGVRSWPSTSGSRVLTLFVPGRTSGIRW
jgi:copper transport protein